MLIVNPTTGGTLIRSTWPIYAIFIFSGVFFTPPTTSIGVCHYAVLSNSFIKPVAFSLVSGTQQVVVKSPGTNLNFDGVDDYVTAAAYSIRSFMTVYCL
jgi:hypothetical protein